MSFIASESSGLKYAASRQCTGLGLLRTTVLCGSIISEGGKKREVPNCMLTLAHLLKPDLNFQGMSLDCNSSDHFLKSGDFEEDKDLTIDGARVGACWSCRCTMELIS